MWRPLRGTSESRRAPALGRGDGDGAEGFRRSHLDAIATQRMMARLGSPHQVARYEDVQPVALMTNDLASADEFIADVLGDLAEAEPQTREVVLAYVNEQFNTSRTAQRLVTHRNTVLRRPAKADELLPRPLAENPIHVAAALDVLRRREARPQAPGAEVRLGTTRVQEG